MSKGLEPIGGTIKKLGNPKAILEKMAAQSSVNNDMGILPNTDCPVCKGAGYIHPRLGGKVDYGKIIPCSCVKDRLDNERQERLLRYCGLPPMAQTMHFKDFKVYPEVQEAYKQTKEVADNPDKLAWVILQGLNDTGKTHLAIAICWEWLEKGIASKYVYVPDLLDDLREGYSKDGDNSYYELLQRYRTVSLLVMDDLGAERKKRFQSDETSWSSEKLEQLVDYRYMNKLSLVVTTNKSFDELAPRLRSRLVRHPDARLVVISAEEYTLRRTKGR